MVFDILKQTVRPEFLNRIDEIIMFRPLSKEDIRQIASLQIDHLKQMLADQEITLETTPEVLDWLAEEGFNPEFGARPLKRVIHKRILKELSKQMLLNKIQPKSHVLLDVFDDTVVFRQPKQVDEALAMGK
jgi:ATP-dependent Clp protease ATP-binding subunit ClpB